MASLLINGTESRCVDPAERGLHYGDGLFETILVRDGQPLCWGRHLERLQAGCRRLGFEPPSAALLEDEARQLCTGRDRSVLKIIVTRGVSARGYRAPTDARPTRLLSVHAAPDYPEAFAREGVVVRVCRTRWSVNPALAGMKHLNRLEQVLARNEWRDPAVAEGLMLSSGEEVISGTMTNLFVVREGVLTTPDLRGSGVEGVMRGRVLEFAARWDVAVEVTALRLGDIWQADEVFLCNSVIGIWPVRQLDDRSLAVGLVARRLQRALVDEPDG